MHFQHTSWLQRTSCPWLINTIFLHVYHGLVIKCTKFHHPNRCIKVGNKPPKTALFVVHTNFFGNQTWPCHSVTLNSDFSFLCMSKHCSITVIYSQSNEFIFCTIHFSFTQLHEMLRLSSNNEVKQKPSIRKQHLLLFDTCSYFASMASFETSIFQWLHLKQLNGFLWNPVFI